VKISRSSSSSIGSAIVASGVGSASAASLGKTLASRAVRRQRSTVLNRPTETSQLYGFDGTPSLGQRSAATEKAS